MRITTGVILLLFVATAALGARPFGLDRAVEPRAVTESDWASCVQAGVCQVPQSTVPHGDEALVQVSYEAAETWCEWRDRSLPLAEDIRALGVSVPAHPKTTIDEWVVGDEDNPAFLRQAGTRDLVRTSRKRGAHGVRCLWETRAAEPPPLPDLEACLLGRRRVGVEGIGEARPSREGTWSCSGLSIWVEMPTTGASWLDHWTGEIQTVVSERSDGSYALAFRRHQEVDADPDDPWGGRLPWFLEAVAADARLKRAGPPRRVKIRDIDNVRRAAFRVAIPGQREGRLEAMWLTHGAWDVALVVGPGRYGAKADADTTGRFFGSVAPSLVPGWRVPLPGGGWVALPGDAWTARAPRERPDEVELSFVLVDRGQAFDLSVRRSLGTNACATPPPGPSEAGVEDKGTEALAGWTAHLYRVAAPAGPRWVATGCPDGTRVTLDMTTEVGGTPVSREQVLALARRVVFP